jgi:predicted metallo-beta-lactamase superfamily hydrolase
VAVTPQPLKTTIGTFLLSITVLAVVDEGMFRLDKIRVTPLAAESFGVRSLCTLVETPDVKVLLDAGVSLCPYRFGLPPHPIEFNTIDRLRRRIAEAAEKAEVVTISHYHFDHHTPSFEDWLVNWTEANETARQIYRGKQVLMKNPKEKINASQRQRAWLFQKTGGKYAKALEAADGKTFAFGKSTLLRFSEPVSHGPDDSMLGWIVMALIECEGERFMFAPDVQGPMSTRTLELIKAAKPHVILIGGPPFYLSFKVEEAQLHAGLKNLVSVVETVPVTILEHHALRDEQWQQRVEQVYTAAANAGHTVVTAAEYAGEENTFLESKRRKLYLENPPSKEFEKWMREGLTEKSSTKPPI